MKAAFLLLVLAGLSLPAALRADEAPTQLLLSIAPDADASRAVLQRYIRPATGAPWTPVGLSIPVLLGKHGLAWGRGLHAPQPGLQKQEGDGRSPAGRFAIGLILGDAPHLPPGAKWTAYVPKTERTAWIDDPAIPGHYNQLYLLPAGETPPPWFEKERVRLNDPAHEWEVLIEHNYPDAEPGAGSAIFFHVRRGEDRPSSGCTVMARDDLRDLVLWLDPAAHPQLVQLTAADYARLAAAWDLPPAPVLQKSD